MDDERRRKIEAGKLKFAELKKRKSKKVKVNAASKSDVSSNVHEKTYPVDPGGKTRIKEDVSNSESSSTVKDDSPTSTESIMSQGNSSSSISELGEVELKVDAPAAKASEKDTSVPVESTVIPSNLHENINEVGSDDHISILNEESEVMALYDKKLQKYQDAVQQRDAIIQLLTEQLESAVHKAADSAESIEIEKLKQEIKVLHLQTREASEMLKNQRIRNETQGPDSTDAVEKNEMSTQITPDDVVNILTIPNSIPMIEGYFLKYLDACQSSQNIALHLSEFLRKVLPINCVIELTKMLKQKVPSEESAQSVLEASSLANFVTKLPESNDFSLNMIQELSSILINKFSENDIQELVKFLTGNVCQEIQYNEDSNISSVQSSVLELEMDSAIKKLVSLDRIAKLIESLISISSGVSDSVPDFSPSKFQSFFLRRLGSSGSGDLHDVSESESQVSDINYADDMLCQMTLTEEQSIEKLRDKNVSEDFTFVTDFLWKEMEHACSSVTSLKAGPRGDAVDQCSNEPSDLQQVSDGALSHEHQDIILQKSHLAGRLQHLKELNAELQRGERSIRQKSVESDNFTNSEDNLLMEEPPLSSVSLMSLTDSEYRAECMTIDSETNPSRKTSLDLTRPLPEREFCPKCERNFELMKESYETELIIFKESLENCANNQRTELLESIKKLESDIEILKLEKDDLTIQMNKQIEFLCQENEMKIQHLSVENDKEVKELKNLYNMCVEEKESAFKNVANLEEQLSFANQRIVEILDEKAQIEYSLQNQIADLVQEHEQDLQDMTINHEEQFNQEKLKLENQYESVIETLKKSHIDQLNELRIQMEQRLSETEQNLINEHSKTLHLIEVAHSDESATYQKKIEQLLEEKCELLTRTTAEYETILKKNHKALVILCKQLLSKINSEKVKIFETSKMSNNGLDTSFSDTLNELNRSIENGIVKFLNQSYFMNNDNREFSADETEYLELNLRPPVSEEDFPDKNYKICSDKTDNKLNSAEEHAVEAPDSLDPQDIQMIHSEINKLQEEFQKDVAMYKEVNDQLHQELQTLRRQTQELEDHKEKLEIQLHEKEKELASKESRLVATDSTAVKGGISGSQLSSTDIRSWQVHAAQTNSRLLHVLSDLVKTFLDIEHDINSHLLEHGLIPSRTPVLSHQDDETGQSVGSREDFTSLSLGDCPNLELTEDGPDLTPRAWDLFSSVGAYDTDMEGEDVVLGASKRLRSAVDHVLNLLTRTLDNQQNQDFKLLLKRNEELSQELQEESQSRDSIHMQLLTAEGMIRKIENEKLKLENLNHELIEKEENLKREISTTRNKLSFVEQEKDAVYDEVRALKEQCELLSSRLGDPEKTGNDKMLSSSEICVHDKTELLQENSKLSSEKHTVQKNLSRERQSFMDRLQEMEVALEELNAEKDDLVEKKCKEIRDLKAEMEAMEKQLQSNRKFIDEQAVEREQEREEFLKEISKLQEFLREKERIQSSEAQMTKEIESLEQLLRSRIEDHKSTMAKKDELEKELRQSVDKIRDLREVIEELEKQLDMKTRTENELKLKLSNIFESLAKQEKNVVGIDGLEELKNTQFNSESIEQLHNLQEQVASQSQEIQTMSQSQTLLHELRGQIHFLEAKVDQRVRQLESSHVTSPVQSDDASPSSSQDSECLHIPCEDGWEMSPRSIHWLEVRRLEEKIGRLIHVDEDLLKKNKDLEVEIKKIKASYNECKHENMALQEKLSQQLIQISALTSHIDEQKYRSGTPQKAPFAAEKLEELQEAFEKQLESNKKMLSELQDARKTISALQDEICHKEDDIAVLQKSLSALSALKSNEQQMQKPETSQKSFNEEDLPKCFELLLLEKNEQIDSLTHELECLQKELGQLKENENNVASQEMGTSKLDVKAKTKILDEIQKENEQLKLQVDHLTNEVSVLKNLLAEAEKQIEVEKIQVDTICEEMADQAEKMIENKDVQVTENDTVASDKVHLLLNKKLSFYENQLKEKNLEILMLKSTVTKLESSLRVTQKDLEHEKVLLETLLEELGSLTCYQKRLEEDYNLVQSMMQDKERELATLQEETDTQLKLETELESLENVLQEQKTVERKLRQYVKELEATIEEYKNSASNENNQAQILMEEIKKKYSSKIEELEEQVKILKKQLSSSDNTESLDISQIKADIMEAVKVFFTNGEDKTFEEILYTILSKAFGLQVNQLEKQHTMTVNEINQSWEQRIRTEIAAKENEFKELNDKLKKENCSLKNKLKKENEKISAERNKYWLEKLQVIQNTLISEQEKNSKLAKCLKDVEAQNDSLKSSLAETSKEKCSLETIANNLSSEVQKLKSGRLDGQDEWLKEFEKRKTEMQKNLLSKFKEEKEYIESIYNDKLEKLHADLRLRLENERITELKHKEELLAVHKYFETRWVNEIQKIRMFQMEELKKFKDSKEKNVETFCNHLFSEYDDKFKKVQKELQYAEEQNKNFLHHKHEWEKIMEAMKSRFEAEKKTLVESKEKEFKLAFELLREKYQKQLLDIQNLLSAEKEDVAGGKVREKMQLMAQHEREMSTLKQELQEKYEKHLAERDAEAKRLEEACRKRVEEVYELMREAKGAASRGHRSDSGSNRTETPSSDITSSDEACSSCQEDMLLRNKHILVNKIHQDGKRVLSLIETVQNPVALEREARLWLEERSWIVSRLKEVTKEPINDQVNLKKVINDLIEELQKLRLNYKLSTDEVLELKADYAQLKHQLNMQQSKLHDLYMHLNQQKSVNFELETLLNRKTSELMELKKSLDNERLLDNERFLSHLPERDSNLNSISSSYEIDQLRSAPEPRSVEKLSLFLPEIGSIPSIHENTSIKRPVDFGSTLEQDALKSPEECCSPLSDAQGAESETMSVRDRFMTTLYSRQKNSDYESKLHGLYWIYRRVKSYNNSLVFQKEYLIGLLRGFQMTEKVTLAWLSCMNDGSSDVDARLRGRSRFRAYAFTLIALQRMKFCVRRRRYFLTRIPSSQVIHSRIQDAFQAYPFLSANLMPGDGSSSSYSLASVPTSLHENGNHLKEHHPSSFLSSEIRPQQNSPTKSQLSEYVHRLKFLQKELGLDNFR